MITEHFSPAIDPRLFACGCGRPECDAPPASSLLLALLGVLRRGYAAPLRVTRAGGARPATASTAARHAGAIDVHPPLPAVRCRVDLRGEPDAEGNEPRSALPARR